jgi:hypothetical protein
MSEEYQLVVVSNNKSIAESANRKVKYTPTGLIFSGEELVDEERDYLHNANEMFRVGMQWCEGDLLVDDDKTPYGEMYKERMKSTGKKYGTLANWKWVAKSIEFSRRRENLSWNHHYEVVHYDPETQDRLLDWCEKDPHTGQKHSVRDLRNLINAAKRMEVDTPAPSAGLSESIYSVFRGDVWQLGNHRIMCGDSYNQDDVDKLLRDAKPTALISDPPYGIDYKPNWNKWDGSASDFNPVEGDDQDFDPTPFLNYLIVCLFGANYYSPKLPVGGWLCWDKRAGDVVKDSMLGSPFELAWYRSIRTTRKAIMVRVLHGGVVNADSSEGNNEKRHHPTQKPVQVMREILENLTTNSDVVYDPFAGSGSTLLACQETGRSCLAMEIDPEYVAIVLRRWEKMTGEVPVRLES